MNRSERVIVRLERAGGSLSEASQLVAEAGSDTIPLGEAIRNVNIMVSDLRRSLIKIQMGGDIADVTREMEEDWSKLWPISPPAPRPPARRGECDYCGGDHYNEDHDKVAS